MLFFSIQYYTVKYNASSWHETFGNEIHKKYKYRSDQLFAISNNYYVYFCHFVEIIGAIFIDNSSSKFLSEDCCYFKCFNHGQMGTIYCEVDDCVQKRIYGLKSEGSIDVPGVLICCSLTQPVSKFIINDTSISESGAERGYGHSNIYSAKGSFLSKFNNISYANLESCSIQGIDGLESESSVSFCSYIKNKNVFLYCELYDSSDSRTKITVSSCNYVENSGGESVIIVVNATALLTMCNFIKNTIVNNDIVYSDEELICFTIENCYLDGPITLRDDFVIIEKTAADEFNLGLSHLTPYDCYVYTPSIIKNVEPIFYNMSAMKYVIGLIAFEISP